MLNHKDKLYAIIYYTTILTTETLYFRTFREHLINHKSSHHHFEMKIIIHKKVIRIIF